MPLLPASVQQSHLEKDALIAALTASLALADQRIAAQDARIAALEGVTTRSVQNRTLSRIRGRRVRQLRALGATVPDDLLAHVAPLGWEHIGLTGDYVWTEANPAAPFRPLRDVRATFSPLAA